MHEFTYITAFSVGLLGGVHCVGMCGGIVGALSFASGQTHNVKKWPLWKLLLSYNLGRILSYTLAGGLMGSLGWVVAHWGDVYRMQQIFQFVAAVFMLMMGLYISGWWMGLTRIEQIGGYVWRYLSPIAKKLLPVKHSGQALLLGLLWGWLPCGLVYSVLIWSISAASFVDGALLMLSFALGTLPNLLAMGVLANQLKAWVSRSLVRSLAGIMVISFGLWNAWLVLKPLLLND